MSDGWRRVPAASVARIEIGGTPAREQPTFWADQDSGNAWASIADLNSEVVVETAEYISDLGVKSSNVKLVPAGTPIMSFKLTIGRTSLAGCDLYTNEAIAAFFADRAQVDPRFLFHALPGAARSVITDVAIKGATLNKKSLSSMQLLLPPIGGQARIVEILTAVDNQIGVVTRSIEKLGLVRQGMVTDLIERVDQSHQPLRRVADLVVAGQFGSAIGPFGSNLMASDYRASGVPVIFVRDIQSGRFDWKSSVYVSRRKALELNAHRADAGDVLITKMGDPPGVSTVHPGGFPSAVITADIIRIRPQEQLSVPEWLALYINSSHVTRQIRGLAAGVTRQKLTLADFRGVTVSLPTIQEQLSTVKRVVAIDRLISSEEGELRKLREAKDGLLADLLTGRVRIPEKATS